MMSKRLLSPLLLTLSMKIVCYSQCAPGTVNATPVNTTICNGNSVNLSATGPIGSMYSWTPTTGLSNAAIPNPVANPSATTIYTVVASVPTGAETIANGDFETLNTGFSSQYTYVAAPSSTALWNEATYAVGSNPNAYHSNFPNFPDHTPGLGTNFMIVNGAAGIGTKVWCQTINVVPGQTYVFSIWAATIVAANASELAILNFDINGTNIGASFSPPLTAGQWAQYNATWVCPAGVTSINFCIENANLTNAGNDFGLDDISFRTACTYSTTVNVNVNNPIATSNSPVCSGQALNLNANTGIAGATFNWTGPNSFSANNIQNPVIIPTTTNSAGIYTVNVTANGITCSATTQVAINQVPTVSVSGGTTICASSNTSVSLIGNTGPAASPTISSTSTGTNSNMAIPDGGVPSSWNGTGSNFANSNITVSGLVPGWSFNSVVININHPWDGDLIVYLFNPCGNSIQLINNNGGSGDNFTNTVFSSTATAALSSGTPPFTGTFIPMGGASAWNTFISNSQGCASANGTWSLHVGDDVGVDAGTLANWTLNFTNQGNPTFTWSPTSNMTGAGTLTVTVTPTTTTTYSFSATNAYGCVNTATTQVIVINPSAITVNSPTICASQTATLTASGASSYTWSPSPTLSATTGSVVTANPTLTTVYSYTGAVGACTTSGTATVYVNPSLNISVNSATICPGLTATLSASGATSYTWSTGATTSSITVSPAGNTTYTVNGNSSGCTGTTTANVTVSAALGITINNPTICQGSSVVLSASGATNYTWSTGATSSTISTSPTVTTTYTVNGESNGCTGTGTGTVNVNPIPSVTATSGTICPGNSVTLLASGATNYTWSTGATTSSVNVSPSSTMVYTITGETNGCSSSNTTTVSVNLTPTITVNSATICPGTSTVLSAGGASSYTWNTGATSPSITIAPSGTTVYTVTGETSGCTSNNTATVTISSTPTITGVSNATICSGTSAIISAGGASSYTWNTGATTALIIVSPTTTTVYSVTGANAAGCTASKTATITVNATPTISVNSATICSGTSTVLTANGATSYSWNTGATTSTISVSPPTGSVTYTVTGNNAGCTSTNTTAVMVNATPTVSVNSETICPGASTTLIANGATSYTWNTGATTSSIIESPTGTTVYTVTGVSAGCTNIKTATITITPTPTITVNSSTICAGGASATLTASGAVTYTWNTGSTSPVINVSPVSTTVYTVTGGTAGCTSSNSATVTVNPMPTITVNNATICAGTSGVLTANGATNYTWNPGGNNTASISVSPTTTTIYTVTGETAGCSMTNTGTVTVSPSPTISVNSATICAGASTVLTASGATSYTWNTGVTTSSITESPANTTTYTVSGATSGCVNTQTATITVNPLPSITTNSETICSGSSTTLTASGATNYTWTPGTGLNASTGAIVTANPQSTIVYTITGSTLGCNGVSTTTVFVNPTPTLTASNATICAGGSANLNASGATSYTWSTGAITPSINESPASTTIYTVTGESLTCTSTKTAAITVNSIPTVAVNNASICSGETAVLSTSVSPTGGNFQWLPNNQTTASISESPASATNYTVIYSVNGCTNSAVSVITVKTSPNLNVTTAELCAGNSGTLTASEDISGGNYTWLPGGETTNTIVAAPGSTTTFTVLYTVNGCTTSATSIMTVNPIPDISLSATSLTVSTLFQDSSTVTASGAISYTWAVGQINTPTITVSPALTTTYCVTGVSAEGCINYACIEIVVKDQSTLYVPNSFTPNGDGLNDIFYTPCYRIATYEIRIFNRWGQEIFSSDDPLKGWDGTFNGVISQDDVYVYIINAKGEDNIIYNKTGHITILK